MIQGILIQKLHNCYLILSHVNEDIYIQIIDKKIESVEINSVKDIKQRVKSFYTLL